MKTKRQGSESRQAKVLTVNEMLCVRGGTEDKGQTLPVKK